MAAFHRFTARRGTPLHLFTDNGTNFVGAHNEIKEIKKLLSSLSTAKSISHEATRTFL